MTSSSSANASGGKHSETPWAIEDDGRYIGSADKLIVCEAPGSHFRASYADWPANARLIVAAPDMLAALKECAALVEEYAREAGPCDHPVGICVCGVEGAAERALAALAKATQQ